MKRSYWKKTVLNVLFFACALSVFAQKTETTYNSVKPFTGSKQFRKLSVGLNAGVLNPSVIIGGSNDFTKSKYNFGYGANVRYQFNHYFALQADVVRGTLSGDQSRNYSNGQSVGSTRAIQSFKTDLKVAASLSGQLTFGNLNYLRDKNSVVPYLSAGLGFANYSAMIVRTGSTVAVPADATMPNKSTLIAPVGLGVKIMVSRIINLDLGYKMYFVDGDELDGSPYFAQGSRSSLTKKDKFSYGFLGVEFAIGNKAKPQLLFDNPVSRAHSSLQTQIDTIKTTIDALKTDTDGDGVADIFDKEPNTPAGSPVDSHGVTRDTDGDGVPDWKDKQLITPSECQPVDADGVGKCPEPACCTEMKDLIAKGALQPACPTDYPSLSMKGITLSKDVKAMLATVAAKLQQSPTCTITLTAYPGASKAQQSTADKKLSAVQTYLTETLGVTANRIATDKNIGGGDVNVIDIK